ncbi:MAG: pentapeptide repeat-containing protein [Dysgonomonas sp.]
MRVITQKIFDEIYKLHQLWLISAGDDGRRANLESVDFNNLKIPKDANFSEVNFSKADLSGMNLQEVEFKGAN